MIEAPVPQKPIEIFIHISKVNWYYLLNCILHHEHFSDTQARNAHWNGFNNVHEMSERIRIRHEHFDSSFCISSGLCWCDGGVLCMMSIYEPRIIICCTSLCTAVDRTDDAGRASKNIHADDICVFVCGLRRWRFRLWNLNAAAACARLTCAWREWTATRLGSFCYAISIWMLVPNEPETGARVYTNSCVRFDQSSEQSRPIKHMWYKHQYSSY